MDENIKRIIEIEVIKTKNIMPPGTTDEQILDYLIKSAQNESENSKFQLNQHSIAFNRKRLERYKEYKNMLNVSPSN